MESHRPKIKESFLQRIKGAFSSRGPDTGNIYDFGGIQDGKIKVIPVPMTESARETTPPQETSPDRADQNRVPNVPTTETVPIEKRLNPDDTDPKKDKKPIIPIISVDQTDTAGIKEFAAQQLGRDLESFVVPIDTSSVDSAINCTIPQDQTALFIETFQTDDGAPQVRLDALTNNGDGTVQFTTIGIFSHSNENNYLTTHSSQENLPPIHPSHPLPKAAP